MRGGAHAGLCLSLVGAAAATTVAIAVVFVCPSAAMASPAGGLPPPDEIGACELLSVDEVGNYRGEAVIAEPSTAVRGDGQRIGSCMFLPASGPATVVSVSLLLDRDLGVTDAPESRVEPLGAAVGDEAWQYVAEDSRGIIADFVSHVVARVGPSHVVTVGGGTRQLLPDPGLEVLLELAVGRLQGLAVAAVGEGETGDAEAAEEATGALGDPVRVLPQEQDGGGTSTALLVGLLAAVGVVALAFERGRRRPRAEPHRPIDETGMTRPRPSDNKPVVGGDGSVPDLELPTQGRAIDAHSSEG